MIKSSVWLLLCCFFIAHTLDAIDDFCFSENFNDVYLAHTEGKWLGNTRGYTTLGAFFNPFSIKSFRPFVDVRTHCFNDGKLAASVGIGSRYFLSCRRGFLGWNIFYDCSREQKYSQQIGIGFELLGPSYDIRVNGYLPVGQKRVDSEPPTVFTYPGGYIAKTKIRRMNLFGLDYEVGARLKNFIHFSYFDLYGALGSYYYHREFDEHIFGGQLRFVATISEYLSLNLKTSYDDYFHHSVQGTICLSIPFGNSKKCIDNGHSTLYKSPFTQPIQRNEIITNSLKYHVWNVNWE